MDTLFLLVKASKDEDPSSTALMLLQIWNSLLFFVRQIKLTHL